ncbi:MAG: phosphate ABC transporter permease PstA [Pseudomonadota bacterium]
MSNAVGQGPGRKRTIDYVNASLKRRYAAERRFRIYGLAAVSLGLLFVTLLFVSILGRGLPAFQQTQIRLPIDFNAEKIDPEGRRDPETLARFNYTALVKDALHAEFPEVKGRSDKRRLYRIISGGADIQLQKMVLEDPGIIGTQQDLWLIADDEVDMFVKGKVTELDAFPGNGIASVVRTDEGEILVLSTSNDFSFTNIVTDARRQLEKLIRRAEGERAQAERVANRAAAKVTDAERAVAAAGELADVNELKKLEGRLEDAQREFAAAQGQLRDIAEELAHWTGLATGPGGEVEVTGAISSYLVQINGGLIRIKRVSGARIAGEEVLPLDSTADAAPGTWKIVEYSTPEEDRPVKDQVISWVRDLEQRERVRKTVSTTFFTNGDSREPEQAGIGGALAGSFFTLLVTLGLSFPIGVAAAVYLEEFAPKNKLTDIIEVNINNLAAVPSIVFGLLGLAVFINFFGLPRSAPLVGGLVLTLMTLPTIIIASRAALKSVPPSIREAALGVGASKMQTMFHHTLPLAMPGMLTGTIIGMAQALGETAPLLMIGMVAFIVDIPGGPLDPSAVLPVQVYLWADLPEKAFVERTAAAIMVLLMFLITMNALAVVMRKRFERRW